MRFSIRRQDFPVNLEDLTIAHLALYFSRDLAPVDGSEFEVAVTGLRLKEAGSGGFVGGGAVTTGAW